MSELAQHAYDAYGAALGGQDVHGNPVPPWEALTEREQHAWRGSSRAVIDIVREYFFTRLSDLMQDVRGGRT
jgi:hypothetical protein